MDLFSSEQKEELRHILSWGNKTDTGDRLNFHLKLVLIFGSWFKAQQSFVLEKKCPFVLNVFNRKQEKKLDANILISILPYIFYLNLNVRANTDF